MANETMEQRLAKLADWLANEAEERMKRALSRRGSAQSSRSATARELREAKKTAEAVMGHKLTHVKATIDEARANADIEDRIAAKLEGEAHKLLQWADLCLRLMAQHEWVKVEERLPEMNRPVLAYRHGGQNAPMVVFAQREHKYGTVDEWEWHETMGGLYDYWGVSADSKSSITHWREIGDLLGGEG